MVSTTSSVLRVLSVLVAAVAIATIVWRGSSSEASVADAVRSAFGEYQRAIVAGDGAAAVRLLSAGTIAWYADMQRLALHATEEEVRTLPFMSKVQVLGFRHRMAPAELRKLSARELVAYGVDHGWVGKADLGRLEAGDVSVSGDGVMLKLRVHGLPVREQYRFVREQGAWRFDQVPILASGGEHLSSLAQRAGTSEDDLVVDLLGRASQQKVAADIWQPPVPKAAEE